MVNVVGVVLGIIVWFISSYSLVCVFIVGLSIGLVLVVMCLGLVIS